MLTDLGLATEQQIKAQEEFLSERLNGKWQGCVGSRICENCSHIISDSVCLCIGIFTCPNCQHENGTAIKKMWDEIRKTPPDTTYTFSIEQFYRSK